MGRPLDADRLRAEVDASRALFLRGEAGQAVLGYERLLRGLPTQPHQPDTERPAEVRAAHVRALVGLAAARFEVSGDLGESTVLLAEATELAERSGDELSALVHGQRGVLLLRAGHEAEALVALDAAVALIDAAAPYDQMMMLLNRGVLHLDRGGVAEASADLERCAALAASVGETDVEMRARHNLGYAQFLAGRIPQALAAMAVAAGLRERPHPIAMLDRARVLREAGLLSEAELLLEEAESLFASGGLAQDVAETRLARAECRLAADDPAEALRAAALAVQTFSDRGNVRWLRFAELMVLRTRSRAEPADALDDIAADAGRLAETCASEGRRDLVRPARLLAAECRIRATPGAEVAAETLRPVAGDSLAGRLETRQVRALAAEAGGSPARAAAEVRRGLSELATYQDRFGSLDLRTAAAVHGTSLFRLGLDLAERSGSAAELFAATERGRAASARLSSVSPPRDEQTAGLLSELRAAQERIRELGGDPAAADELDTARSAVTALQRRIRERAWELEGGRSARSSASARVGPVAERALALGSSFVSFVAHGPRLRAVLASTSPPRGFDLGPVAEVDELVARVRADLDALALAHLPEPLLPAVRRSLDAGLRRLDETLLAPFDLPAGPLVVSCSSSLAVLPWSLLPSRDRLPVVVTPSATAWLASSDVPRPRQPSMAAVAGPGLQRAEREVLELRGCWPQGRLLTGAAGSTTAVAAALGECDLVHVATHGVHQQESPLFSSLRLADGPLFAYELDAGEQIAGCVVLSACEAGLSTSRPGDEGLGLTSVLLHLGTRSVLAGVARVRDDVAAEVMTLVHRELSAGRDSAAALAEALTRTTTGIAPFVAFGASW